MSISNLFTPNTLSLNCANFTCTGCVCDNITINTASHLANLDVSGNIHTDSNVTCQKTICNELDTGYVNCTGIVGCQTLDCSGSIACYGSVVSNGLTVHGNAKIDGNIDSSGNFSLHGVNPVISADGSNNLQIGVGSEKVNIGNASGYTTIVGQTLLMDAISGNLDIQQNYDRAVIINSSSHLQNTVINNGIFGACGNIPTTGGVCSYFNGEQPGSISLQEVFGDSTGWKRTWAEKHAGVATNIMTLQDNGNLTLTGNVTGANLSGTNSGNVTLAAVGAVPNANSASLSGQQLTLQPASSAFPGVITTGNQTLSGSKIFNNGIQLAGGQTVTFNTTSAGQVALQFPQSYGAATTVTLPLDPVSLSANNTFSGTNLYNLGVQIAPSQKLTFNGGAYEYVASAQTINVSTVPIATIDCSLGTQTLGKAFSINFNITGIVVAGGTGSKYYTGLYAVQNYAGTLLGNAPISTTGEYHFPTGAGVLNATMFSTVISGTNLIINVIGVSTYTINWNASLEISYTYY